MLILRSFSKSYESHLTTQNNQFSLMALLDLFAGRLSLFHLIKFSGFILISQRSFDFIFSKVPIFCGHSTRNAKRPLHCVFSLYPWKELQTQDYQDTVGYSKGNDFQLTVHVILFEPEE